MVVEDLVVALVEEEEEVVVEAVALGVVQVMEVGLELVEV